MVIGFVIPRVFSVSETFIRSKIKMLENLGHEVIIFAKPSKNISNYKTVSNPSTKGFLFILLIKILLVIMILFLRRPKVSYNFLKFEKDDGVTFIKRWKNLYLNSHILSEKIDWLHFSFATMAISRENVAISLSIPMSTSIRGYDVCVYQLKNPGCYDKLWSKVTKVHSISKDLVKISEISSNSHDILYEIIPPAIDINAFNCSNKIKITNIKNQKVNFLTIARLNWVKGLESTLEALAIIMERGIDFHFNIIGTGREYERLIFATDQLRLTKYVNFLGDIDHNDVYQFYNAADIYLQYSINEGFCNSVLEAQSMGLLTIASNAGGLTENVIHEKTGWIVKKNSPISLANTIELVINKSSSELYKVRKNAIDHIKSNFRIEKQAMQFDKFFN